MASTVYLEDAASQPAPANRRWARVRRLLFGRKLVLAALAVVVLVVIAAILAPWIAPYNPYTVDLGSALQSASARHWLGTDELGRDILSRILFGARISLEVGVVTVCVSGAVGCLLGLLAGYFGGFTDAVIMRAVDALMSVPPIILALAIGAALGGGLKNVIISLGIAMIPPYTRLLRGQVMEVRHMDYTMAALVSGASSVRIMFLHVLPNCLSPLIVMASLNLGFAVLAESGLSFLGLGVAPPQASWGEMVNEGYRYLASDPLISLAPGCCIVLLVLAFNIIGDATRDLLDPRLKERV